MYLEIVSPEQILFSGEVTSVAVPGIDGEFEMLNNHAAVVSLLAKGKVKIFGDITLDDKLKAHFTQTDKGGYALAINSGTLEMNVNKAIILAD